MPDNEKLHICKLRDPSLFKAGSSKSGSKKDPETGKNFKATTGTLKADGSLKEIDYTYDPEVWSGNQALKHCRTHKGEFEPVESEKATGDDLNYRSMSVRLLSSGKPATLDKSDRSVEVVVATEQPAEVYDYERWEIIQEVLLMSGVEMPSTKQVPLLDTHRRFDTASVLGSVRTLSPVNGQLIDRAYFSEVDEAKSPWTKVSEGHLTDFSVGYKVKESEWVPSGESKVIDGQTFEGPVIVVSSWMLKEVSIVPIGADELAKVRAGGRSAATITKEPTTIGGQNMDKTEEQIRAEERQRVNEIDALCRKYDLVEEFPVFIRDGVPVEQVNKRALEILEARMADGAQIGYRPPVEIIVDQTEKRVEATVDGLVLKSGIQLEKAAPGANEYRVMSFAQIAAECELAAGRSIRGLSNDRLIAQALTARAAVTADFPYILANTSNKILRQSYDMTPSTFELWTNITDAKDFKTMSRNQLSEAPDLEEIPEHGEYRYVKFTESKEEFAIAKYGSLFAITREALINDDMGAFTRIPQAFAQSAKRRVNSAAYAVLTGNAAMADGVALFHSDHSNYVAGGSGAAPGEATLNAARVAMRSQTGLQGALLNVAPIFLIVPAALETTADKLLNSTGDLADNKSSGVVNPFYGKLEPVVEVVLDVTDAATWYMAADPRQIDTVEVALLGGQRGPYLETKDGWSVDGVEYKVRIEFGTKAIDHRGLYCNDGN